MKTTHAMAVIRKARDDFKKDRLEFEKTKAKEYKEKGFNNFEIGLIMMIPESTIRIYLKPGKGELKDSTFNSLMNEVEKVKEG